MNYRDEGGAAAHGYFAVLKEILIACGVTAGWVALLLSPWCG